MNLNKLERQIKRNSKRVEKYSKHVVFENVFSPEKLYEAFQQCCIGYKWKSSVQFFNLKPFVNCLEISESIKNHTYSANKLRKFTLNERGKIREIQPISFQDRIVQHSICKNCLEPIIYPLLVYDNSASQKGKGTSFAIKRFSKHLKKAKKRYGNHAYVVQVDIKNYFGTINSHRVCEMIDYELGRVAVSSEEKYGKQEICRLIKLFLLSSDHLELGNQLSQIAAVFYLNKLDHYVIEQLGISLYGRYMDDIYAICKNKEEAMIVLEDIKRMLIEFGLRHHERKSKIVPITSRLVFLKTVFMFEGNRLNLKIPSKTIRRHKRHYRGIVKLVKSGVVSEYSLTSCRASFKGVILRETLPQQTASLDSLKHWYDSMVDYYEDDK